MLLSFQYLRVFATFVIVAYHAEVNAFAYIDLSSQLPAIFSSGHNWVSLFFVLSGFVVCYSCCSKPRHGFSLIRSRFIRLYPTYLLVASLVFLSILAIPSAHNSGAQPTVYRLFRTLVFDIGGQGGYVFVGWTLWYEMLFTLAFATICSKFPVLIRNPYSYCFTGCTLLLLVLIKAVWFIDFVIGAATFLICTNPAKVKLFESIAGLSLILPIAYSLTVFHWPTIFALILASLYFIESNQIARFNNSLLLLLAKSSYSIFLVQVLSIVGFLKLAQRFLPLAANSHSSTALLYYSIYFVGSVLATFLAGMLLYSCFEAPAIKFFSRKPSLPVAPHL
jgi:peptidoglycan/LPS O-acetylase OafA/YrhL